MPHPRLSPEWKESFRGLDLEELDASPDLVYALSPDLRLCYFNLRWETFARENQGDHVLREWPLGISVLEAISDPTLRRFYARAYGKVGPGEAFACEFECSTSHLFRRFRSHTQWLSGGVLLIVNTLLEETPVGLRKGPSRPLDESTYRNLAGQFIQCAECRRTATADRTRWDWIPALAEISRLDVSHGLCPVCLQVYAGS